jgi:serine/threonine-protein kinase HipA
MGALEFEPTNMKSADSVDTIEIKSLVEIAQKMLTGRENFNVMLSEHDEEKALSEILKIGTSAGGARAKAVIAYNKATGEIKSGQANAPIGFEHWLLKLDGVTDAQFGESYGYGRVEFAYYLMAKDCGIDMMDSELLEENGRAHFMTKRFDRDGNNIKHHIQTWCGMQHLDFQELYSYSYEQLFQTMRLLRLTYPEAEQMFKRMVFNVLATNYDDHTKNFSFRLKKGGRWELSPAYDICYSYDPNNVWVNQLTLSINGKHKNITTADFMTIAIANNIKKAEQLIEEIKSTVRDWEKYAKKANVRPDLAQLIKTNLNV